MRPVLKPGVRRFWRDGTTLQIGADPAHALVVGGVTPLEAAVLDLLDGSREWNELLGDIDTTRRNLLLLLERAGMVEDAERTRPAVHPGVDRDRLLPDLAALAVAAAGTGPWPTVERRRGARVEVRGVGRVGAQVATLLAAAGIGRVIINDPGVTRPADVCPGGPRLDDIGRPRAWAVSAAMARLRGGRAPGAAHDPAPSTPHVVVVAPVGLPVVTVDEAMDLAGSGVPHLLTGLRETTAVIGPFVLPGRSACLYCQHLHRQALDPAWHLLAPQMARSAPDAPEACEITLATMAAAVTASQVLTMIEYLAGGGTAAADRFSGRTGDTSRVGMPASADGTLEMTGDEPRIRRRSWPPHAACRCGAATVVAGPAAPAC